ncbi:MAG TPA: TonB family protein [Paraburkholderia sp.]|jgi:protein TonB|nr:TonB family protein [Paraburkholderia sp.]
MPLRYLVQRVRYARYAGRLRPAVVIVALSAALVAGCTITPLAKKPSGVPPAAVSGPTLDRYHTEVAQHILEHNPSYVLHGTPQAMLRSVVVVAFTVDRNGRVVQSSVYRTNGDDEAEATALATLRRSSPLPPPPGRLLDARGRLELMEDWLFNDNGKFQLRTLATPQSETLD